MACVVAACEPPPRPDPCDEANGPFVAEVGTGPGDFTPLVDGAQIPYVNGIIQGGTHVEGALRITGLLFPDDALPPEDELPVVTFVMRDADGAVVRGYEHQPRLFVDDGLGHGVLFDPVITFVDASTMVGEPLVLAAHVVDRCGHEAAGERSITLVTP